MRGWLMVVAVILSGCAQQPESGGGEESLVLPNLARFDDGVVHVDVPVPVVLIGFEAGLAGPLQERLDAHRVEQVLFGYPRALLAPTSVAPAAQHRVQPTADYRVHELPLEPLDLEKEGGLYLARQAEDAIVDLLTARGLAPRQGAPSLVFLHLGDTGHSYRMEYETGYVDGVRVFGERHPLLVMDTSAAVDPWVGDRQPYNRPMGRSGDIETLVAATQAATEFRLLQGPIYPPSIKPCHAVTLVTAIRSTALATHLPGYADPHDLVDVANLTQAWEALLGEGRVHIDAVFLQLPQDDPQLEIILRSGPSDLLRYWMDENWDDYWVPHEGCEAYVSLFVVGDSTDSGVSGIAMYDVRDDRRLSWSAMNDLTRFREEQDGAFAPIFYANDPSRERLDWLNFLYTHETGHLFGQRHPHDISTSGGGGFDLTFSSIWSAMSYQQDGKVPLFGAIDANNQARNRAGFLLEAAFQEEKDVAEALELMASQQWWEAAYVLEDLLYDA